MKLFLLVTACLFLAMSASGQAVKPEIDAAKLLWHSYSNASKYFGKPVKILKPREPGDQWDWEFGHDCGIAGTKDEVLMFSYRFKKVPKSVKEALEKVGLSSDAEPSELSNSYVWYSRGKLSIQHGTPKLGGRQLNRIILTKDLKVISVDGHTPGTY